eukprot:scaffold650_cov407-Prasinococcus_capsulatus_cf.AAC.31
MSGVLAQLPHKLGDEAGEAADLLEDTLGAMDMLFAQRSVNDLAFGYYDELLASLADLGIQGSSKGQTRKNVPAKDLGLVLTTWGRN